MPAGFAFPHGAESLETTGKATDIWMPWAMTPQEKALTALEHGEFAELRVERWVHASVL